MHKIQRTVTVVSNSKVCPQYYRLSLDAGSAVNEARPGQFIHIRVTDGVEPFFRRPFSVFRAAKTMDILYDVVGKGTEILSSRKRGDRLDVLGPLGTPFCDPAPAVRQVVMIAGGIGVAPFLIFSDFLKKKRVEKILLYGARAQAQVFDFKAFRKNGVEVFASTEDGSVGVKGRVTRLFGKIRQDPQTTMLYACGPKPMLAAVQDFAKGHRLPGQVSCEEVMACGLGACLGCSIPTVSGYKTVCHDGPVFDVHEPCF
ncbi:MAG TPA: dihydroorotate dehydrogenase electron transfer subunit [Candidatus Omnitrophota bacterium]|nr:dihydroorotate dehydrogenase electron transfer subunit [Candidatus Omnitrophota bacterium]